MHVSDIHCNAEALTRVVKLESFDLLLATGDYECLDVVDTLASCCSGRALAVTGNLDDVAIRRALDRKGLLLDGRVLSFGNLAVAGVGGIDYRSDVERLRRVTSGSKVDVLLSHHPPKGVLDRALLGVNIGLAAIGELARLLKPKLHLFGHVHESPGEAFYDGVVAVNPGPLFEGRYALIEMLEAGKVKVSLKRA
ncbi:MAG: metallophosphoesterase family protein [Acidilobus sp.]